MNAAGARVLGTLAAALRRQVNGLIPGAQQAQAIFHVSLVAPLFDSMPPVVSPSTYLHSARCLEADRAS